MKFAFVAKRRGVWPVRWMCESIGVSRSGFHAWLARPPSRCARVDEEVGARVRASFLASDRTYGARRVWQDVLADGFSCGLHKVERLMRAEALRARPRRRGVPKDEGVRRVAPPPQLLDRQFTAERPNRITRIAAPGQRESMASSPCSVRGYVWCRPPPSQQWL